LTFLVFAKGYSRNERPNINTFSDADKKVLIDLMDEWLSTFLSTMHGDNFGNMHTTNDYLRWHRDHFIDLERFILDKDPDGALNYSRFVPFPKWDPNEPVPVYFNGWDPSGNFFDNISSKCQDNVGQGCRTREDYLNPNPGYLFNQNNNFTIQTNPVTQLAPLPTFFRSSGNMCATGTKFTTGQNPNQRTFEFEDITDYSDFSQIFYHNRGHTSFDILSNGTNLQRSQMGNLQSNRASAVYLFWLWHAWVDDMWWDVDANCRHQNNGTTILNAYDEANGFTVSSGSNIIWGTSGNIKKIQGNIVIQAGATLTIENGQILEILDDYYTNQECFIIVEKGSGVLPGGKLIVRSGAIIRGITSMGSNNGTSLSTFNNGSNIYLDANNNPIRRVMYLSQWPGIKVYGDIIQNTFSDQHGSVSIDGSQGQVTLDYAKTAITSIDGGVIICKNVLFKNCTVGVDMKPYLSNHNWHENQSKFENCTFSTQDQITKYFTGDNTWMHYKHPYHHHYHVKLEGVRGISFAGCTFENLDPNEFNLGGTHNNNRGTGIWSLNASYAMHKNGTPTANPETGCPDFSGSLQCVFRNLSYGIDATNTVNAMGNKDETDIFTKEAKFENCHDAIHGKDLSGIRIYNSTFTYDQNTALFPVVAGNHHHFVDLNGCNLIVVYQNEMTSFANLSNFVQIVNNQFPVTPLNYYTKIQLNEMLNNFNNPTSSVGVFLNGDNMNTDIKCNSFQGMSYAIENWGQLKDQGRPGENAGNVFLDMCNHPFTGPEQKIRSFTSFRYFGGLFMGSQDPRSCSTSPNVMIANTSNISISGEINPICLLGCSGYKVGINKLENSKSIQLYPNPSNQNINIENLDFNFQDEFKLIIYDMVGKKVIETSLNSSFSNIDINELNNGIYIALVQKNNETIYSQKLIKE
jgi:hypothetical protein